MIRTVSGVLLWVISASLWYDIDIPQGEWTLLYGFFTGLIVAMVMWGLRYG